MHHAERNGFLAPEQYGGRKGKRSIDHVLNKRLTYDLIRLSRRPAAVCSNDAKSCYDRASLLIDESKCAPISALRSIFNNGVLTITQIVGPAPLPCSNP